MNSKSSTQKISAWISAARLQFYPMTFIAYSLGAVIAYRNLELFNSKVYLLGYLVIFLIELLTVLSNEYYDYKTDEANKNFGIFTGGSRVLVEEKLSFKEIKSGMLIVFILLLVSSILLLSTSVPLLKAVFLILIGIVLGVGYTAPPLKFSYKSLGELDVAITHSPYVILCGYLFQGGGTFDPLPWIFSLPLFLAVFAAITLAGIPDYDADKAASKKSLAVTFGIQNAALLAIALVVFAAATNVLLKDYKTLNYTVQTLLLGSVFHGVVLILRIRKFVLEGDYYTKIDKILLLALSYIPWYGVIPIVYFLMG